MGSGCRFWIGHSRPGCPAALLPASAVIASVLLAAGCNPQSPGGGAPGEVAYAGVRSSSYGAVPYPDPQGWVDCISVMADPFPGSTPCALWIVGTVDEAIQGVNLEFPSPDSLVYPHVSFSDEDLHEEYLEYFDTHGVSVFLQVEPGYADVGTLIYLVMLQYGSHPCVAGFGVDVEWYGNVTEGGEGTPVTDSEAAEWEGAVQSYSGGYALFLKHWDPAFMPPSYRGDIVFVDDGQGYPDMASYLDDMELWAETFAPNTVFFQYGYDSDSLWWGPMENAPYEIGAALAGRVEQDCGLIWVDFNLDELQ